MEKDNEIYCAGCGCSTVGEVCQICGSTENRHEQTKLEELAELNDYFRTIRIVVRIKK